MLISLLVIILSPLLNECVCVNDCAYERVYVFYDCCVLDEMCKIDLNPQIVIAPVRGSSAPTALHRSAWGALWPAWVLGHRPSPRPSMLRSDGRSAGVLACLCRTGCPYIPSSAGLLPPLPRHRTRPRLGERLSPVVVTGFGGAVLLLPAFVLIPHLSLRLPHQTATSLILNSYFFKSIPSINALPFTLYPPKQHPISISLLEPTYNIYYG